MQKISRASFDGTNVVVLVKSSLRWPNGIVVDESAKRIYWADADKLESCDVSVSRITRRPGGGGKICPFDLLKQHLIT